MVHLCITQRLMDKLAAQAICRGHTITDEIARRLELSFSPERAAPRE
jgi:hypothetical protein